MTDTWLLMVIVAIIIGPVCAYRAGRAHGGARTYWLRELLSLAVLVASAVTLAVLGVVSVGSASLGAALALTVHFAIAVRGARRRAVV